MLGDHTFYHAQARATCAGSGMKSTVLSPMDRLSRTGLVFQFPERHFLASTLQQVCHNNAPMKEVASLPLPDPLTGAHSRIWKCFISATTRQAAAWQSQRTT